MTVCTFANSVYMLFIFPFAAKFQIETKRDVKRRLKVSYTSVLIFSKQANHNPSQEVQNLWKNKDRRNNTRPRLYNDGFPVLGLSTAFLSWGCRRLSCLWVLDVAGYIHTHSSLCLGNRPVAFFDYIATRKTRLSINKHTKSDQNHE
jgi:hypothetical protein